jgi:hypothetical protein
MKLGRRKTKSERDRERIEGEYMRQQFAKKLPVLVAEAAAVAQLETETRRHNAEPPICPLHPSFDPRRKGHGIVQPRPDPSECDLCAEERTKARLALRARRDVDNPNYNESRFPPRQAHLLKIAKERHEEKLRAAGIPVPGSEEEHAALERIEELRDQELRRQRDTPAARRARARKYWGRKPRSEFVW